MQGLIETTMYQIAQVFMFPTLALIIFLFLYAFWCMGAFFMQGWKRKRGGGGVLLPLYRRQPDLNDDEIDLIAHKTLELPRIVSRVMPMLGLVATMIPMGPLLKSLSDGNMSLVANDLAVVFSAVILSLIAASITHWVVNVRRRWLSEEILEIAALRERSVVK